jgi:hypothetical protein
MWTFMCTHEQSPTIAVWGGTMNRGRSRDLKKGGLRVNTSKAVLCSYRLDSFYT